ncbi:MAG: hypothetical protein Ct9H300mP4_15890 [Gammaproteobacteria bacterium]|nr:MAG: hypothetical protein Ct9H300mP4_15890 [Gammaproteobacteria bacterium]
MMPSNQKTEDQSAIEKSQLYRSTMDALTRGTQDGLQIVLSVAAMLVVLISLVSLVNYSLEGCQWSLESLFHCREWLVGFSPQLLVYGDTLG